jgi:hypothetical protein
MFNNLVSGKVFGIFSRVGNFMRVPGNQENLFGLENSPVYIDDIGSPFYLLLQDLPIPSVCLDLLVEDVRTRR